ncbi:uncharacterized protein DNG_05694 [Cephalotrichum gorgonifer]|uniref:Cytochrome b561 domain-containing protein n=1 Tax=Cephalotrichum gorgonifer TaxID=2041049 RepID=A0AAE8SVS1_9PEZI|nr:uncharacterized protein DNG_05694 [Cephalotrichum gorgonifer]
MAPAPQDMSSPGTATYDSDTLSVGDGTWDFSKNTFLLPPLVGVPFDTMRYNGESRPSRNVWHRVKAVMLLTILAHAILGALVFLLLVPVSVFAARFYDTGRRVHARLNIFAGLLLLAAFILGYFAVGPERSLTNPHHGIGVAIFLIFILQMFGGWLVSGIRKYHSFRITLHQWSGRVLATLGIIQVPLGLTLFGSPLYTFVLYTVWMSFLLLVYFIMDYRRQGRDGGRRHGGRSDYTATNVTSEDGGGKRKWLAPLLAGAGVMAVLNMRKKKRERSLSRSPSRSRRSRSYSRSRMDSRSRVGGMSAAPTSYYDPEKHDDHDRKTGGGWMSKLLPAGAAFGAWKLATRGKKREHDAEYSSVAMDTPSRPPRRGAYTTSDLSEISDQYRPDPRRDPRGPPRMSAHAMSAVESAPPGRRSHGGPPRPMDSQAYSGLSYDDGSYDSPSRRPTDGGGRGGGAAKGLLAGLGMGWLASKFGGGKKKAPRYDDDRYTYDDEQSRLSGSRYTGDPYTSPPRAGRRDTRRLSKGGRRGSVSHAPTEDSSVLEPRYGGGGPPMPPLSHGAPPPPGGPVPPSAAGPGGMAPPYASRHDIIEPVDMPAMPPDRHADLPRDSRTSVNRSPSDRLQRRDSSRRRKAGAEAAAAAAASASALAAEEESRHGARGDRRASRDRSDRDRTPTRPPRTTIKMTVHDDRVNLRRLTDEEASKTRRSRRGGDSASTLSDDQDTPPRRYRRDASRRRAESSAAERPADVPPDSPLSPPNPAFASGRGRAKDSAYYSGQPGGPVPVTPQQGLHGQPISSVGSGSHGTWSEAVSPSPQDKLAGSAADNRRRRRQERRRSVSGRPAGADMFD